LVIVFSLTAAGCNGDELAPIHADYMLHWYAQADTDYGDIIPGFNSLAMCRRAGSSKTIASLRNRLIWTEKGPAMPEGATPWFECMSGCRPYSKGSYLVTCKEIQTFKGSEALSPY
jgi:hypothetical protein